MRLPRLRMQLRWLMFLVAVAGLILGTGVALRRRQQLFEQLARDHSIGWSHYARSGSAYLHDDASCAEFREKEYPPSEGGQHLHPLGGLPSKHDRQWMRYHGEMTEKYGFAARWPGLPVGADPPAPSGPDRPDDWPPSPVRSTPAPDTGP